MNCRPNCGACCIAISISSPLPGLPDGKPAGVRCVHLNADMTCDIYDRRPAVCRNLRPTPEMCGNSSEEAMKYLTHLEKATSPV